MRVQGRCPPPEQVTSDFIDELANKISEQASRDRINNSKRHSAASDDLCTSRHFTSGGQMLPSAEHDLCDSFDSQARSIMEAGA